MTSQNQNSKTDTDEDLMNLSLEEFNEYLSSEFRLKVNSSFFKDLGRIPREVEQCAWEEIQKMCDDEEPLLMYEAIDEDQPVILFEGMKTSNGEHGASEPIATTSANVAEDPNKAKNPPSLVFRRRRSAETVDECVDLSTTSNGEVPVPVVKGMPRSDRSSINDKRPAFSKNLTVLFGDRNEKQDKDKKDYRQMLRKHPKPKLRD